MRDHIGRYEVIDRLGAGSFATVHRALDLRLDDEVAVKVLAENHTVNPEMLERFIGEGRALRRARSPHVAAVHDIGELPHNQPYLVLELADRGTLGDRVEALRAQGWKATSHDVLLVARSLTAALGAVHRARLVHRDLSPWNLLLTSRPAPHASSGAVPGGGALISAEERLLLVDLGICKDLARSSGMTVAAGTSGFRPPEQERHGQVDARADVWAMSAVLQWITDGAALPAAFHRALARGMAENPRRRPGDAEAWLESIEAALAEPPAAPAEMAENDAPAAPAPRRRLLTLLAVGLLVVGLVAGIGLGNLIWDDAPVAAADGALIAIEGPEEVAVGDTATFTADVTGADTWVWVLPDGRFIVDESTVSMTAASPGNADVVLRSLSPNGTTLEIHHRLHVDE
ncbi:protein kinase domain-containing protein [Brachybacterium sp. 107]|uniref:protein kinase domain-containing protein n=1 Tax=Brachybacterium sp. 107 TaxID=3457736 RepID=UPI004033F6E1